MARHDPGHYLNPKRAAYDLPNDARVAGIQFRWYQTVHDGAGHDQWAIDSIEIIQYVFILHILYHKLYISLLLVEGFLELEKLTLEYWTVLRKTIL